MSRWKRLLVGLGIATLLSGFYASFFGVQTFLTLKARYIAWKLPAINNIPVELTDLSISQANGKKLSYCGYEFEVPWLDIDEAKTRIVSGNKAIVTFRSGNVLSVSCASAREFVNTLLSSSKNEATKLRQVYGDEALQSDYAFHRIILETTPDTITPFISRRLAVGRALLLGIKRISAPRGADSGVFAVKAEEFAGFQYGRPGSPAGGLSVELFTDSGSVDFVFDQEPKGSTVITQPDINRILHTFHKPSEIFHAANIGDLDKLRELLKANPALVFSKDSKYGWTPLYWASRWGHKDAVELLLAKKADINSKDSPLCGALIAENKDMVEFLLAHGADVNTKGEGCETPLVMAVRSGNPDLVEVLLVNKADVHSKTEDGDEPLHLAVRFGSLQLVQLLLANNADINAITKNADAPLHLAARLGHTSLAKLLLANKADVNAKNLDGEAPLHVAVRFGQREVATVLLTGNADVNAKSNDGSTPLHLVADLYPQVVPSRESLDFMQLLLANNADVNARNNRGETPLHKATFRNGRDLAELLLANKAPVNAKDNDGDAPLHIAALGGDWKMGQGGNWEAITSALLAHGADVNVRDNEGRTPMHGAALFSNMRLGVAELLWAKGADINATDNKGETPLRIARRYNEAKFSDWFVQHGAHL